ncbi:unnamed protein product [Peniophora sp. CBMAI 1063]|nr:unnamed protein product [Peniophora sp. CBMAI 1063]
MNKHRAASQDAWDIFLRSRFESCARASFEDTAVKRAHLADLELETMLERVVFARQQRNKVMGACRLPPEVLSNVFSLVQLDKGCRPKVRRVEGPAIDEEPQDPTAGYSSGWMCLLHVCSYWRQTALGTPSLWCNVPCLDVHPDSIPTLLARSRGLPLSLVLYGSILPGEENGMQGDYLDMELSEHWFSKPVLRRTRQLLLDDIPDAYLDKWFGNFRHPMPLLETFKATCLRQSGYEVPLPIEVFFSQTPLLRSATITGLVLPNDWKDVQFPTNIEHLALGFDNDESQEDVQEQSEPTSQSFYKSLSVMKGLKSLSLGDIFPDLPNEEDPPIQTTIYLPVLTDLRLATSTDFPERCMDVYQRLSVPDRARVTLDIATVNPEYDYQDRLLEHIIKLFGPAATATPISLCASSTALSMEYTSSISLGSLLRQEIPDDRRHDWANWRLGEGARALWTQHGTLACSILPFFRLLPLRTLQAITFIDSFEDSVTTPPEWLSSFVVARNVEGISIHYYDALTIFDALSEASWGTMGSMLFPRLSTLALHAYSYQRHSKEKLANMRTSLDVLLLDLLHVRKEKGVPIETLWVSRAFAGWDVWGRAAELAHVRFF